MKIKNLANDLMLVMTDYELESIKKDLGADAQDYDGFFVNMVDGEITECYGFYGAVPSDDKEVYEVI